MLNNYQSRILTAFGAVSILCGVIVFIVLGSKSLNFALATTGIGAASWLLSYMISQSKVSIWLGSSFLLITTIIFGHRLLAHLLLLIGIVQNNSQLNAYDKCISTVILIILCNAGITSFIQYITHTSNENNNVDKN